MLVDPNTGMPMDMGGLNRPGSLGRSMAVDAASSYGMTPSPWMINTLNAAPSVLSTAGWNSLRGSRTIRRGAYGSGAVRTGTIRGGMWGNHLNPRSWGRFSHASALSSVDDKAGYTPFNFMARTANWGANKYFGSFVDADGAIKLGAGRAGRAGLLTSDFVAGEKNAGMFFSPGIFSRVSAAQTIDRSYRSGKAVNFLNQAHNGRNFIGATDTKLSSAIADMGSSFRYGGMADAVLMSSQGTVNQYVGGYVSGLARQQSIQTTRLAEAAGKSAFLHGRNLASEHLLLGGINAGEKIGAKAALGGFRTALASEGGKLAVAKFGGALAIKGLAMATPGINIAMTAWMVHDLAKMGVSLVSGAGTLAKDAAISMRGTGFKPVFGMGFKDNTVAATSRSRGVQAIANSRLNARSVLGNEAGMLHSHFG